MLVNTQYFSEAAIGYKKNKGIYCKAPETSREFIEFWDEETKRCKQGYKVGNLWIPGRYYFYLNYCPISRIPDGIPKGIEIPQVDKIIDFPKFWEVQLEWWTAKHIASVGSTFKNGHHYVKTHKNALLANTQVYDLTAISNRNYKGGEHITCLKTRGCGFSYMEAADGIYNYNFIPKSKSYYFSAIKEYLIVDGILNKCWDYLEFLNTSTQKIWRKNRQIKDTIMHKKSSYYNSNKDEKGYKSEIFGVIVDDANKVRGKRGVKLSFEEGGSFKNLKSAIEIARPLVEQGGYVTGQISIFGTGGEQGENIEGLEEIFSNPEGYNMMRFDNIYDEGGEGTECGFFVPASKATDKFIDEEGNSNELVAQEYWLQEREIKKKAADQKTLDRFIAERPLRPREALQRLNNNLFPIHLIDEQINYITRNKDIQGNIKHGIVLPTEKGLIFRNIVCNPILKFPHLLKDDLTGAVTIYEMPFKDSKGHTPDGMYIAVHDPYTKDEAQFSLSLGVTYVLKIDADSQSSTINNIIVASYIGRPPKSKDIYNNNMFNLVRFYNAKLQAEIEGGGRDVISFAKMKKLLHLLEFEPEMYHNKELASNQKNRAYLMNMTADRKNNGLLYIVDWLLEVIGVRENGSEVLRLHKIYDIGLLLELKKYNNKGNFDRVSALIIAMYMIKEKQAMSLLGRRKKSDFFNRNFFSNNNTFNMPKDLYPTQ